MEEIQNILKNPIVKTGLSIAAPEIAIGVDLIIKAVDSFTSKEESAQKLLAIIDKELAKVLETLATTKSRVRRRVCEAQAYTLLGVLNEWEKIT